MTLPQVDFANPPAPSSIIAFDNGLLDIDTGTLYRHTPRWFSPNCLDYPYDPTATCPRWHEFLMEASQTEGDWLDCLQMWFGYNLVADVRQEKMMLFVGPPRSGKGTTCNTLQKLIGEHNYCNPSLSSLGQDFGLAPLMGKLAAIVPDAHLGRTCDPVLIMERLKSIIGQDSQSVNRKHRDSVNVRLMVRFTVSVNELVAFPDASAAMRPRLIILPFRVSHAGREDIHLKEALEAEISGICNWALEGLRMLRKRQRFAQPAAGQALLDDFSRLSAPVRAFLEDWCHIEPGKFVRTEILRDAWRTWCEINGHEAGSDSRFGERLYAAAPGVERVRRGSRDARELRYEGIELNANGINVMKSRGYTFPLFN